jgi:single-strand DNA-binding protein
MANDLNLCQFIGRLGKDVEMRYTNEGKAIASLSIAVGESWTNKQTGDKEERTEWINVTAFGKLAEIIGEYLKKGSQVYLSGKWKTDKYQDRETGQDRYSTKLIANQMQMLGGRNDQSSGGQQGQPAQQQPAPAPVNDDLDDDIPF